MEPEADAMALASDAAAPELPSSQLDFFKTRVRLLCDSNKGDFDSWVSLINGVEGTSADDIEVISLVYHSFLLEFPLCYGYWIKYAAHKARLCTTGDVVDVYEQAVHAVPHSVDIWVSYCGFCICAFEEPAHIRRPQPTLAFSSCVVFCSPAESSAIRRPLTTSCMPSPSSSMQFWAARRMPRCRCPLFIREGFISCWKGLFVLSPVGQVHRI